MMSNNQKKLFTWYNEGYDSIVASGSVRSGKSYAMSIAFIFWAMNNFDKQIFIMAGQSITSLKRNVILKLVEMLKNSHQIKFGVNVNGGENYIDIRYKNKKNRFYTFGGGDAGSFMSIQGLTAAGAFFDETTLLNEEFVNQATARCSVAGAKFWFTCNPSSPGHWFKKEWIDKKDELNMCILKFTFEDNPSLGDEVKERYRRLYKGVFKSRYVDGDWCYSEGLIYENWEIDEFNWARMEMEKDYYRRDKYNKLVGLDFGYNNPNAVLAGLEDKANMTLYIYKEIYRRKLKTKQLYEKIKEANLHKFHIVADSEAPGIIDELSDYGLDITGVKKYPGSVKAGIQKVQGYKLIIHPDCKHTISELQSYSWKNDKATNQPLDEPLKENDHLMDALRYMVMGADSEITFY